MPRITETGAQAADFLFDNTELRALADAAVIGRALRHVRDNRVLRIAFDDGELTARVEDADSAERLDLALGYDADGNLWSRCACADGSDVCVHSLAALLAFASGVQGDLLQGGHTGGLEARGDADRDDRADGDGGKGAGRFRNGSEIGLALESAIEERMKRGRTEVQVEPLTGQPWFGTWRARSVASTDSQFATAYQVQIRSLTRRANHCSCPDFATNQLGTCKHIEAVLHQVAKRPDYQELAAQPPPLPYVYLDWEREDAPRIRLHRRREGDKESAAHLAPLLDRHFDAGGAFVGRLPDDFLRFAEGIAAEVEAEAATGPETAGGGQLLIGDDALAYARRMAEDAAREGRAREIGRRLRDDGLAGIRARLYPYQVEGAAFLAGRGRALLADDMGLGKTLQAIAAAHWLRGEEGVEKVLIVCPASLKFQWAREIERFTGTEAHLVQGPVAARSVQYRRGSGYYVLNYELVLRDLSLINEILAPDLLILDEAQRIKNWRTKIATAVKRVPSRYAFVLSGTPLENRLEDLYSLMQVVDPRVLGPLWRYMLDFHVTDERGKVLAYRNLSELRRRLKPVMLRRDRTLVRDQLPSRIEQRRDVPMTSKQREIHDEALGAAARVAQILKYRPLTPAEQNRMLAALQRARMACNAAGLVDRETAGSPKLDELASILEEACLLSGLKVVVFSQWARMGEMVEALVRRLDLGCVRLHGGVPSPVRGRLMDRFQDDDGCQVFISTDAGGTGLNLQSAAVLVNLDIPWNPAVLDQRVARVHRLGQRSQVQVLHLVASGSYEEQVLRLIQGKRNLFDNVVETDATEDVVGISKRLAEVLAEDLVGRQGEAGAPEVAEPAVPGDQGREPAAADSGSADSGSAGSGSKVAGGTERETDAPGEGAVQGDRPPLEPATGEPGTDAAPSGPADLPDLPDLPDSETARAIRRSVLDLSQDLGPRIERILLTGDAPGREGGGLLVVLDSVNDDDEARATARTSGIPIALIDRRTLAGLERLGAASPVAGARSLYEAPPEPAAATPPLARHARLKLEAATVLLAQDCPAAAGEMLLGALLCACALRCGLDAPPEPAKAAVWLYVEALPSGRIGPEDAALVTRALALVQPGEDTPAKLIAGLAEDVGRFVDEDVSGSDVV